MSKKPTTCHWTYKTWEDWHKIIHKSPDMTDMGIDTSASVAVSALPLASPAGAGTGSPSMWLGWHLLNTLGKSDQIWDGQFLQDSFFSGRTSKNCRPSSNELWSGAFQSSNSVLSLHMLFILCYPRSKPIHHATLDPRNQKSCCLSAVSHRAHLLRGCFAAPERASIFHPKITHVGVIQQLWQRISDPNMFTQEVCNHSLPVEIFKGWR